jgi:hypothetical protein
MSPAEDFETQQSRKVASPAGADRAGDTSADGASLLLQTLLKNHRKLGLDSTQIAGLSRLYWSAEPRAAAAAIEEIERTLSPEQFRQSVTDFATALGGPSSRAPIAPADIDALVKAALNERTKDKDAIPLDLATKAADLLIGWARMFAFFVAVPAAVILAGLSFVGYSKFQDVQNTAVRAEATLHAAQENVDKIAASSKQVDNQLAELGQRLQANDEQIRSLDTTVRSLAEKLNFGSDSGLSASQKAKLTQAAASFLHYFEQLGYTPKTKDVNFTTKVDVPGGLSYYDANTNSIVIQLEIADDETILLHEYAHRILYSSLAFDAINGTPAWNYSAVPIEYGLDDYFIASFRNDPVIGALAAKRLGASAGLDLPLKLQNNARITATQLGDNFDGALFYRLGSAWGAAFWELRLALGQDIADKSLYEAWRTLVDQNQSRVTHSFIANIATQLNSAAGKPAVKTLRDILARRGISAGDLPEAE